MFAMSTPIGTNIPKLSGGIQQTRAPSALAPETVDLFCTHARWGVRATSPYFVACCLTVMVVTPWS